MRALGKMKAQWFADKHYFMGRYCACMKIPPELVGLRPGQAITRPQNHLA
jgi:hypothetical protein